MSYYCETCGKFYRTRKAFIEHPCFKDMLKNHRQSAKPNYTGELGDLYEQNKVIREKKPRKFVKYDNVREISGKKPGEKKKNRLPKLASAQGPGKGEVSPKPPS